MPVLDGPDPRTAPQREPARRVSGIREPRLSLSAERRRVCSFGWAFSKCTVFLRMSELVSGHPGVCRWR